MRANFLAPLVSSMILLAGTAEALGQPAMTVKVQQAPADDEKDILNQIKEAYKAPYEVHEDVLKELRRQYQQPTPKREEEIFKELRRLYNLTPERESAILREIRRSYEQPTPEQEDRIFREIARAEPLPLGAVPATVQVNQAQRLFGRFDANGDGQLSAEEMPAPLRGERARWDSNRDGLVNLDEFWGYYQGRLGSLSERVASGEIDLKLGNRGPMPSQPPANADQARPTVFRAGQLPAGLPDWFVRLDTDRDGQVGLYEWLKGQRPLNEFLKQDANNDGLITAEELLRHLAQESQAAPAKSPGKGSNGKGPTKVSTAGKK